MESNIIVEVLTAVRTILELGWPGIVLIMLWLVWSEYRKMTAAYIATLREIAGLTPATAQARVYQKPQQQLQQQPPQEPE